MDASESATAPRGRLIGLEPSEFVAAFQTPKVRPDGIRYRETVYGRHVCWPREDFQEDVTLILAAQSDAFGDAVKLATAVLAALVYHCTETVLGPAGIDDPTRVVTDMTKPWREGFGVPPEHLAEARRWCDFLERQLRVYDHARLQAITDGRPNPLEGCLSGSARPTAKWPPGEGWHFRLGEAAFRRHSFVIGKGAVERLLKRLAVADEWVSMEDLQEAARVPNDPSAESPQENTVRGYLSELKKKLTAEFDIEGDSRKLIATKKGLRRLESRLLKPRCLGSS